MYNAPAVSYPVGRSHFKRLITWALLLLALSMLGFWCQQAPRLSWPQGLGLGVWLLAVVLALHDASHPPQGHLSWDEREWQWAFAGQSWTVAVRPQLDGQRWILLALSGAPTGSDWLWVERAHDPMHWDALRRALWAQEPTGVTTEGLAPGLSANPP
jgi:hypothetical protein